MQLHKIRKIHQLSSEMFKIWQSKFWLSVNKLGVWQSTNGIFTPAYSFSFFPWDSSQALYVSLAKNKATDMFEVSVLHNILN